MYPDTAVHFIIGKKMKLTLKTSAFLMIAISTINNTKATEQSLGFEINPAPKISHTVTDRVSNRNGQNMKEDQIPQASSVEIKDIISHPNSPILDNINEQTAKLPQFSADSLKIGLMQEFMIQLTKKFDEQTQELNTLKTEFYNQQKLLQELQDSNLKLEEKDRELTKSLAFLSSSLLEHKLSEHLSVPRPLWDPLLRGALSDHLLGYLNEEILKFLTKWDPK